MIQTHDGLKAVLELDEAEIKWWRKTIGDVRKRIIPSPTVSVNTFFKNQIDDIGRIIKPDDISTLIRDIREGVWNSFVGHEVSFFAEVVGILIRERDVPNEILDALLTEDVIMKLTQTDNQPVLIDVIADIFQDYAGPI